MRMFVLCCSEGNHTLSKTVVISTGKAAGKLSRFTTKKATCVGCRVPIKGKCLNNDFPLLPCYHTYKKKNI